MVHCTRISGGKSWSPNRGQVTKVDRDLRRTPPLFVSIRRRREALMDSLARLVRAHKWPEALLSSLRNRSPTNAEVFPDMIDFQSGFDDPDVVPPGAHVQVAERIAWM